MKQSLALDRKVVPKVAPFHGPFGCKRSVSLFISFQSCKTRQKEIMQMIVVRKKFARREGADVYNPRWLERPPP
jgi:hypothetical protein